jgi:thioesterase domain-containing protein
MSTITTTFAAPSTFSQQAQPLAKLQQVMHRDIPLTKAIGIRVSACNQHGLVLSAPLEPNVNDKGSVFSGSLSTTATLAGWGSIWLLLHQQELTGTIVIQDSTIQYLQPVWSAFYAQSYYPPAEEIEQFYVMLRRRKRARLAIRVEICDNETTLVTFQGRYVAQLG